MGSASLVRCVLLSAVLAACSSVHAADNTDGVPTKVVRYDDLDLTRSAGVERLFNRIVAASNEVCPQSNRRELARAQQHRRCMAESVDRAIAKINQPNLTAYGRSRLGVKRVAAL